MGLSICIPLGKKYVLQPSLAFSGRVVDEESPVPNTSTLAILSGQKIAERKFPEFFRIFVTAFAPNFAPNCPDISRIFRASFHLKRRPEKIHQKSPPFFNAKFPGKYEKYINNILLESRQSNILICQGKSSQNAQSKPQNESPRIPWIGIFLGSTIFFTRKP